MQVSGNTCRRSLKIFRQRMGKNHSRSVGSFGTKRRPQIRFPVKIPFHRSTTDQCQCSTRKYFTAGGRQIIKKGAIESVPPDKIQTGFYSTFFLVPKKMGDLRPVMNL